MDPVTRAFFGNSPMVASAVTDLPEPDSPTIPRTSSGARVREIPRTARTVPSPVANSTVRSSMARTGSVMSGPDPVLLGVERLPQSVPDEEDREDQHDQEDHREHEE